MRKLILLALPVALAACGNQTADQKAAGIRAGLEGARCLATAAGAVVPIAAGAQSDAVKAIAAAGAVTALPASDPSCAKAVDDAVQAVPAAPAPVSAPAVVKVG